MNGNVLISFVVPVYNVPEKYLRKCLDSLLNQTEKRIEIVVVDDGSTDNSPCVIDEYAKLDSRMKIIHKENAGLSAARNTGVQRSTGVYVSFVDGDDYLDNDFSKILLEKSSNYEIDIVIGKVVKDYGKYFSEYIYKLSPDIKFNSDDRIYFQSMILDFYGNISGVYGKLIKRELLEKQKIFHDENLSKGAEGIVFNFVLFGKFNTALFVNKNLYHYMYNENSISAKPTLETNILVVRCFERIKYLVEKEHNIDLLEKLYERMIFVIITTAISGIFHPKQSLSYSKKKKELDSFLKIPFIMEVINKERISKIDIKRKMTFYCIIKKRYFFINILAKLRFKQRGQLK